MSEMTLSFKKFYEKPSAHLFHTSIISSHTAMTRLVKMILLRWRSGAELELGDHANMSCAAVKFISWIKSVILMFWVKAVYALYESVTIEDGECNVLEDGV